MGEATGSETILAQLRETIDRLEGEHLAAIATARSLEDWARVRRLREAVEEARLSQKQVRGLIERNPRQAERALGLFSGRGGNR